MKRKTKDLIKRFIKAGIDTITIQTDIYVSKPTLIISPKQFHKLMIKTKKTK